MEYVLDASNDSYIKVTVTGVTTKPLLAVAISELMNHPDYIRKHALWDLSRSSIGMTIGDLKEIAGLLSLYKPQKKNFANKSAIVVPGQMHRAMANLFISAARMLPFEYKAFNDIEEAVAFVSG